MVKQVKSVKVYWNDPANTRPSYYPDMKSASDAIGRAFASGGWSASGVVTREVSRFVNMNNAADRAWYERHVGRTCRDAASWPSRRPYVKARDRVPAGMTQLELGLLPGTRRQAKALGDRGYETSPNPARQAAGAAVRRPAQSRTKTTRRPRGSVGVKDMSLAERRLYWRWADARKRARAAGITPPGWDEWRTASAPAV